MEMPNTSAENPAYLGLRVNLIGEDGHIDELLLPRFAEGKYRFAHTGEGLLSIEALNEQWMICCEAGTCFVGMLSADCRQTPLIVRQMYFLHAGGRQYILYAETITKESSMFRNYRAYRGSSITFGRDNTNDIVSANGFVSHRHAVFSLTENGWEVRDLNSSNGVYVNHRRITAARLRLGDVVYLMGPRIIVGTDFLSICSGDTKLYIKSSALSVMQLTTGGGACSQRKKELFNRSPRSRYSMEWPSITVDAPPMPMRSDKMPLVLRMGSSAVMGGRSIMMGSYSMALTSLVFPFLTQRYTEKERKEYEERRVARYSEYLEQKKQEIEQECRHEYQVLNANYPSVSSVLNYSDGGSSRLWERRNTDDDFLTLRIGSGTIPMQAELEYPKERFEMEQDTLEAQMYALTEQKYMIPKAPVMLSVLQDRVCGVVGDRPYVLAFVRGLAAQLIMTHSYDEVKCVLLLEPKELDTFNTIRYLPHTWSNERNIRFLATSQPSASAIGEYLRREMEPILRAKGDAAKYRRTHPHYVVFALSRALYDNLEVIKDVLAQDEKVGLSVVAAFEEQPKESTRIFRMNSSRKHQAYDLLHPDLAPQLFELDAYDEEHYAASMKELANTSLMTIAGSYSLPKTFTFLEMFGVGKVEHLNLLKRWADSDPTRSLAAPIGVGTDGELFMLDLHEKRQGPHGLVAGMTGSGKSEFIITYILSMAVNFSPDEVAFLLIDYKGGGLADAFDKKNSDGSTLHLPHLVGTITNLDGAAVSRSMISIESELERRQRIFKEAKVRCNEGTMDIYDYQQLYRAHRVEEPLPHLFIISDEFAELKSQQPEFMDKLISTARIGRSLGVHLILATQKPSGVVNDQIWSNTKFRVCLRVQDTGDSQDMLKRPDAASLKDTGRFYLQVGYNEYFALGQSAWCGADYIPQDEVIQQKDESVQLIDDTAQTLLAAKPIKEKKNAESKQIVAIVKYLSELAEREHILPRTLLPPALSDTLTMAELQEKHPTKVPENISACIGMIDDPAYQRQYPLELNLQKMHNMLLVGESGCGKTTLVQTMLLSLAQRYTPEQVNFYVMDFSSKLLVAFRQLPHCGAVLTDEEESAIDRLFEMITEETRRRQRLFAKAEVGNYEAYCRIERLPLWVVVIDGMGNFTANDHVGNYATSLYTYMRDAPTYGIQFVLTGSHGNEITVRAKQETSAKIAMSQKDKYSYLDILDVRTEHMPPARPGRGLCVWEGRPLEFQTAIFTKEKDPGPVIRAELERLAAMYPNSSPSQKVPTLSDTETYEQFRQGFAPLRIPLGYGIQELKPVAIPLKQLFSISLYFGNPVGVAPVVENFLRAYAAENMELVIVQRSFNSIFSADMPLVQELRTQVSVELVECSREPLRVLLDRLLNEMQQRSALKQEFCEAEHVDAGDLDSTIRAFPYIHARTTPLMVIFESYYDFATTITPSQAVYYQALFEAKGPNSKDDPTSEELRTRGRGYNLYYTGCFYPGDADKLITTVIKRSLNPQNFTLMFGGQFNRNGLIGMNEYDRITKPAEKYNRFIMNYDGQLHEMMMPCGALLQTETNPDDESII